jgi:hypothetical protein
MAASTKRSRSNGQEEKPKGEPPVFSRRLFTGTATVEVAVFEKEVNAGEDSSFIAYNVSCKRTYKDGENYKSTQGFRADDVPFVIQLLTQAYAWIATKLNER